MKIKLLYKNTPLSIKILYSLMVLLLLFDRGFSKFTIIEGLYLHDLLLLFAAFVALLSISKFGIPSIFSLIIISVIYLIYSIFILDLKGGKFIMVFRHFFLFFYLISVYIIVNKYFINTNNIQSAIKFIIKISKLAIVLQIVYTIFLFISIPNYSPFSDFSYLSSLSIMAIITYAAYTLVYISKKQRLYYFFFVLIISTMLGHSSAFLAVFIILLIDLYIYLAPKQRLITLVIAMIGFSSLFLLPQFNDVNAGWRLLYWQHVFDQVFIEKFMILGHGFGIPFMTEEFAYVVKEETNSQFMIYALDARWVNPPHNSFLTIMFHVGFVPFLLLLKPLKGIALQLFIQPKAEDKDKLFLTYSLIGLIVWVSFNVVLELPHSAIYFWLIYFTYIFYEIKNK